MGKKFGIGCLGIIVLLFFLGLIASCASSDSDSDSRAKESSVTQKEEDTSQRYVCDVNGVGKVVGKISSDVGIAVFNVYETNTLGDNPYATEHAQGKFVVVSVVVTNNQKDAVTVDASSFEIVDANGREFEHSTEGQTAIQVSKGDAKGFLTKLNPGITTNFVIPYDVPSDLDISSLQLKARGGMTGEEIMLPLTVQLAQ